jgi:hypothetical protein
VSVRLRAHHLLCMLTFAGEGYTPDFTANFAAIAGRIRDGEAIQLVDGADDVCAPLASSHDGHCAGPSARRRDRAALLAITKDAAWPATAAGELLLDAADIARLRIRFASGSVRRACDGCEWSDLCTQIAADSFAAASL